MLVHGDKLAGILIDLLPGRGRPPAAVIGIGLNLRLPDAHGIENQAGVTDLAQALECEPPAPAAVLAVILTEMHRLLDTYAAAGFPAQLSGLSWPGPDGRCTWTGGEAIAQIECELRRILPGFIFANRRCRRLGVPHTGLHVLGDLVEGPALFTQPPSKPSLRDGVARVFRQVAAARHLCHWRR